MPVTSKHSIIIWWMTEFKESKFLESLWTPALSIWFQEHLGANGLILPQFWSSELSCKVALCEFTVSTPGFPQSPLLKTLAIPPNYEQLKEKNTNSLNKQNFWTQSEQKKYIYIWDTCLSPYDLSENNKKCWNSLLAKLQWNKYSHSVLVEV